MKIELDELLALTDDNHLAALLLYALWNKQSRWQDKIPHTPRNVEIAVSCCYTIDDLWKMTGHQDDLIPLYEALKLLGRNGYVAWFPTDSPAVNKFHVSMPKIATSLAAIRSKNKGKWQRKFLERCWPALAGLRST